MGALAVGHEHLSVLGEAQGDIATLSHCLLSGVLEYLCCGFGPVTPLLQVFHLGAEGFNFIGKLVPRRKSQAEGEGVAAYS
jgi:hypothetical protein